MTGLVAALAPLAAAFFDEPRLLGILPVLGLNFLIRSVGATHYALAQKEMLFRTRTIAEFATWSCAEPRVVLALRAPASGRS